MKVAPIRNTSWVVGSWMSSDVKIVPLSTHEAYLKKEDYLRLLRKF